MNGILSGRAAQLALLLGLWLVWGYSWIMTKTGLMHISPMGLAVGRSLFALASLLVVLLLTRRSLSPPPFRDMLAIGLTQNTGFYALSNLALLAGGAGKVSVLCYTMPFWTLLFARVFLGEQVRGLQWIGVMLALSGLICILEPWALEADSVSNWLAIAAGMSWAVSVILLKRFRARHPGADPINLTFWQMVWGTLPLIVLWLLVPNRPVDWGMPLLMALLFLGVLGGGLGWLVWALLLGRLSAGTASLNILAIPGVAVFLAWLQLGEVPDRAESIGMGLIACALAVLAAVTMFNERRLKRQLRARTPVA
ncbi:MAG: DMT family transporter [Microvirgula sp.]